MKDSTWKLIYKKFEPKDEKLRESLCTLGNGYFATRGAFSEVIASPVHYPGTYIAGVYNRLKSNIAGRTIMNEDLVNCPNWMFFTFKIDGDLWFWPSANKILFFKQELDMRNAILIRTLRCRNSKGQKTFVETYRIVSMTQPHIAAMKYIIKPENYSGWITIKTMLDGTVQNTGVERYRQLNTKHLVLCSLGSFTGNGIYLSMKTSQSKIEIAEASVLHIFSKDKEIKTKIKYFKQGKKRIGQEFRIFVQKDECYEIERVVSIYTSKDKDVKNAVSSAVSDVRKQKRFKTLFESHKKAWSKLWNKFDIQIEGDNFSQKVLRLHMFHLLQSASLHNTNIDAGLGARGLHGEAYRGHVFWDEVYAMPFYDLHIPEISKALLLYRYRRLSQARQNARTHGFKGAMFPWQSGSSGREETPSIHLNPLSNKWGPDYTAYQRHVSFAVAFNVWRYWVYTADNKFLESFGAELILSIAQFASSLVKYSIKDGRYHTYSVMGPDEFHEKYPDSSKPGLNDNAYTNFMIVWTLIKTKEIISVLSNSSRLKIFRKLKLRQIEIKRWDDIIEKMKIVISEDGIISQFDGYFELKELDWTKYRTEYENIQRMDRILKAEGKLPDYYKVSKQADVLMSFYLLPLKEIKGIFQKLGYRCNKDLLRKNYTYYIKRTTHGSTLSKVVHSLLALQLGKQKQAWRLFLDVLKSDIYDTQGGTTCEGIHMGVMGGSFDIVMRGFAGINLLEDRIKVFPHLPQYWKRLKMKFYYKKRWFSFDITKSAIKIFIYGHRKHTLLIPLEINGRLYRLSSGKNFKVYLN